MLDEILLIDDDDDDNFAHRRVIDRAGVAGSIAVYTSVDEGLAHLRDSDKPMRRVVFVDINMPRKSGWDFLAEFERLAAPLKQGVVVVLLTSSTLPADRQRAESFAELDGYLTKPITPAALQNLVEKHFPS